MSTVRRLETASAVRLGDLAETFEELQQVLRCCERLVALVPAEDAAEDGAGEDGAGPGGAGDGDVDQLIVEALWTTALLSYGRCFASQDRDAVLTEEDLGQAQPEGDVLGWHQVMLRLRDHYAQPAGSPREQIHVGIAQDEGGGAAGVAVTSQQHPMVDGVTVRQLGAIAYALARLLDERIQAQQQTVYSEMKDASPADLESLEQLEVASADDA